MWIKLISPMTTARPMDSIWKTRMAPPLSLLVLGSLTPPRHKVGLEDGNIQKIKLNDSPDLVGITVKVDTAPSAFEIADRYRTRGIRVVMGGIHATSCPEDCAKHADSVVIGDAEENWPLLVEDAEKQSLKPVYRNSVTVDPAKIPIPRWEMLNHGRYLFTNTLTIGRGCPWRCDFCYNSSSNIDSSYRMKSIPQIIDEICSLGTDHVMFIDDNFIGSPEFVRKLLPEFKRLGITWQTAVSTNIGLYDDILDMMAEAGCKSLFIGFESVNQKNLMDCRKTQNRIQGYDSTIAKIHARGMMVNASLVFGFDGDDVSVFPATFEWLVRNRIATMTAHILTPYPGTVFYRKLETEGRIIDRELRHYNTAHAVFMPAKMSPRELVTGYLKIYDDFYSWLNILRRLPVSDSQVMAYLQFNLLYRKFGKQTSMLGRIFGMRRLAEFARRTSYPKWRRMENAGQCNMFMNGETALTGLTTNR
ncbi:MAG TPA: B12-binding domain-containing radical SAM protein [Lentisphaeria bacterium]|nr:MAG: hypothetical protein A2X48_21460 [Lentisphaerae bacterium GWF2_49_21]HBC85622.1 B12-binding domain-containing radical SAM protein [Lentisphaeria bacterium]